MSIQAPNYEILLLGDFSNVVLDLLNRIYNSNIISISLKPITSAMTNKIYSMHLESKTPNLNPKKLLLKLYGESTETFISRDNELFWLSRLSHSNNNTLITPIVMATFTNGRIERFIDGETLNVDEIRSPNTSKQIAHSLAKLHSNKNLQNGIPFNDNEMNNAFEIDLKVELWNTMRKYHSLYQVAFNQLSPLENSKIRFRHFDWILNEINFLEMKLKSSYPLVLCHNDVNIINNIL